MSSKQRSYAYDQLKYADSIRLLTLWPAPRDDMPISCTLKQFSKSKSQRMRRYKALSYTWGSDPSRIEIVLNGRSGWVTSNLHAALQHFRDPEKATIWWIDALCINQAGVQERTQQVGRMQTIYSDARQVVAWLGPSADNSDIAMGYINKTRFRICQNLFQDEDPHAPVVSEGDPGLRPALDALFLRPYWFRVWIIQEITVNTKVIFICGDRRVHIADMSLFFFLRFPKDYEPAWKDARRDLLHVPYRYYSHRQKLEEMVVATRFGKATNPRDRIIALLGLVEAGSGQDIKPDYTLSACQIFSRAIQAMLADRGSDFISKLANDKAIQAFLASEQEHGFYVQKGGLRHWKEGGSVDCDGSTCGAEAICFNTPVIWRPCWYGSSQQIIEAFESRINTSLTIAPAGFAQWILREVQGTDSVRPPGLRPPDTGPLIWG